MPATFDRRGYRPAQDRQIFFKAIQPIVDPATTGDFNQAIMDLGSSYMTAKNPTRNIRPFGNLTLVPGEPGARLSGEDKKPRPKVVPYYGLLVQSPAGELVVQRTSQQMLTGYWTYPWSQGRFAAGPGAEPTTLAAISRR
ncbi:hypothetical protein [Levilactobacillus zymae]|uniref:hypothetical protein n=1 Tax=Levilactobacillus zymae TaxID=267363 RepID=UPI001EE39DB4|nr:hypothetical protein [Levilactobacillus zymae]